VVYETLEADGEPLRTGRVLSADFTNAGRRLDAMWFQEPGQRGGYYNFDGQSLERAFLASPLRVLARDQQLRDALPPDPARMDTAQRRRLRRAHRHPVRSVGEGRSTSPAA
jgi:hypothetical protein